MKKSILFLLAILAFVGFQQCVKEQNNAVPVKNSELPRLASMKTILPESSDFMKDFVASSQFKDVLDKYQFFPVEFYELHTNQGDVFYAATLGTINGTVAPSKENILVVYPNPKHGEHKVLIYEQEMSGMTAKLRAFDTQTNAWLAEGEFRMDGSGEMKVLERSCATETNSFSECFVCGWNVLASDPISIAACIAFPWSCVAAVTAHCTFNT